MAGLGGLGRIDLIRGAGALDLPPDALAGTVKQASPCADGWTRADDGRIVDSNEGKTSMSEIIFTKRCLAQVSGEKSLRDSTFGLVAGYAYLDPK